MNLQKENSHISKWILVYHSVFICAHLVLLDYWFQMNLSLNIYNYRYLGVERVWEFDWTVPLDLQGPSSLPTMIPCWSRSLPRPGIIQLLPLRCWELLKSSESEGSRLVYINRYIATIVSVKSYIFFLIDSSISYSNTKC